MFATRPGSIRLCLFIAGCIVWTASSALAQVASGAITGIVKDQAGAVVPGATVTVTDIATNRQRVVVSSGGGVYAASSLSPGSYRLEIALAGFKPTRRQGILVSTGETLRVDFELSVGDVREQVTITADAPMLRSERAGLGTVVTQEQVVQLPLNGRAF